MISKIINLTRTSLPKISKNPKENIAAVYSMPEMVLSKMAKEGNKSIVHVDMNHCAAARISPEGINTIYTDALNGCNSVGIVAKGLDGKPVAILSHYVPTNVNGTVTRTERLAMARACIYVTFLFFSNAFIITIIKAAVKAATAITSISCPKNPAAISPPEYA